MFLGELPCILDVRQITRASKRTTHHDCHWQDHLKYFQWLVSGSPGAMCVVHDFTDHDSMRYSDFACATKVAGLV